MFYFFWKIPFHRILFENGHNLQKTSQFLLAMNCIWIADLSFLISQCLAHFTVQCFTMFCCWARWACLDGLLAISIYQWSCFCSKQCIGVRRRELVTTYWTNPIQFWHGVEQKSGMVKAYKYKPTKPMSSIILPVNP